MPIYEYDCPKCGHFEAIQSFSEKPLKCKPDCAEKKCPKKAERLISASAFHLKGTGWYKTDYAGGSGGGAAKSDGSKSDAAKSDTEKSDSSAPDSDSKKKKKADGASTPKDGKKGSCGPGCGCH